MSEGLELSSMNKAVVLAPAVASLINFLIFYSAGTALLLADISGKGLGTLPTIVGFLFFVITGTVIFNLGVNMSKDWKENLQDDERVVWK